MVKPKKHLGQHFLSDPNIARKIAGLIGTDNPLICELGPGTGVLTKFLLENKSITQLKLIEIDEESVAFLNGQFTDQRLELIKADFLKYDLNTLFGEPFSLIGNFPYNISSQIFFRVLENKELINEVVCMIQKEVADRIVSAPGNKTYGILSVLLQSWFDIDYCFTVSEKIFIPPPKVKSAVIKLTKNKINPIDCDEKFFFHVVKTAFNQRRKTLRNALRPLLPEDHSAIPFLDKRAEQLSKFQFAELTKQLVTRI
jgi:16S rRNA (adenine1518-N6/adenine1519-N6)-dimethyltransferase